MENFKVEELNELLIDLAYGLEMNKHNSGETSVSCEVTHLLQDMSFKVECLRRENASLLSEYQYITEEKNELREGNYALQKQIERLQNELKTGRMI